MRYVLVTSMLLVVSITPAASPASPKLDPPRAWRAPAANPFRELGGTTPMSADRFEQVRRGLLKMEAPLAAVADPEFVFPARAGDLDADGKNDLLTFEFAGNDATLRARKGSDGSELWNVPGAYFALPIDIDGDGAVEFCSP
jgi:hypothetical protein